jgi:hypothetical protein
MAAEVPCMVVLYMLCLLFCMGLGCLACLLLCLAGLPGVPPVCMCPPSVWLGCLACPLSLFQGCLLCPHLYGCAPCYVYRAAWRAPCYVRYGWAAWCAPICTAGLLLLGVPSVCMAGLLGVPPICRTGLPGVPLVMYGCVPGVPLVLNGGS